MKAIDNFPIVIRDVLKFRSEDEFYLVLILRRRKDVKGKMLEGVNEDTRLIKHYFVYDKQYLCKKEDAIKALCEQNNARAYILPQRRCCRAILWALHDKVSALLKENNKNTHFDHLIRTTVAGMHETAEKWHKRWIVDIDADDAETVDIAHKWCEKISNKNNPPTQDDNEAVEELAYDIASRIRAALVPETANVCWEKEARKFMPKCADYSANDISVLPTPHGFHIVTPPFNRKVEALRRYLGGDFLLQKWIMPDASTLLYAPRVAVE